MPATAAASTTIHAPAPLVWEFISDVTRMGEWSPETTGCRWLDSPAGPRVGARFQGRNKSGSRVWKTACVVTEAAPGQAFAFDVRPLPFLTTARWRYDFTPTADGCEVTESWVDGRGRALRWLAERVLKDGGGDRAARNRQTIPETLARLKAAAEAAV